MSDTKIHLTLGCFGYQEDGFVSCGSVENKIFTLTKNDPFYMEAMNYLDLCKLFDQPNYDYNTIRNFLVRFREKFTYIDRPVWSSKQYENYHKFILNHKICGLILKLDLEKIETISIPTINRKLIGR